MQFRIIQLKQFLLFAFLSANAHAAFEDMVVFGDSLSDSGNFSSVKGAFPSPPFFEGSRVSNGPVAIEGLAAKLGLQLEASMHLVAGSGGHNYAVVSARARAASELPIDLATQVSAYLLQTGGVASEDALYVIFIGGNDLRDARGKTRAEAKEIIDGAVQAIDEQLRLLIEAGAQHFMVVNSPDIGTIPETRLLAVSGKNKYLVRQTKRRTREFNRRLARNVKKVERDTGLDIVLFDVFAYMKKVVKNAQATMFLNTKDACFSTISFSFNDACEFGQQFDSHLFFDEIHPTGRTHERVSRAMYAEVPEG